MSEKPRRNLTHWAVVLGVASIGLLGAIAYSLREVWRADRALAWPTTNGTIVESRSSMGCGRRGGGYFTVVRYRYQVGGASHESRRVLFGAASCDSKNASTNTTNQFPTAAAVKVAYDPQAPGEAVLIPGKVDAIAGYAQGYVPRVEIRGTPKAHHIVYADFAVTTERNELH